MRKKRIIVIAILTILLIVIYYYRYFFVALFSVASSQLLPPDLDYVREHQWVYENGFKIGDGDFVEFEEGRTIFQLKHDTIYFRGNPHALVTKTNKYFYQMNITSIDGSQKGEYANTEEFTH